MALSKTIFLPKSKPAEAREKLKSLVNDNTKILFFVFGDPENPLVKTTISRADKYAGTPAEPFWVVSIPDAAVVLDILKTLKDPSHLAGSWSGLLAAAVSMSDKVCDVIAAGNSAPTDDRVVQAWTNAEADNAEFALHFLRIKSSVRKRTGVKKGSKQ